MRILLILMALGLTINAGAQCDPLRYKTFLFDSTVVTEDVVYGSNQNVFGDQIDLKMDVYVPFGDEETARVLIILAHGGSFLVGDKADEGIARMARQTARLGYVSASINYRLGLSTNMILDPPDSLDAMAAVVRGMHDMKAAIRWFRKNAAEDGNQFGIDPDRVFVAGVSAGGFIINQLLYLDEASEMPVFTPDMPGLEGGIPGNSGNPGWDDEVIAGLNVAGALIDTAWIRPGDEPLMSTHGTDDNVVPFGYDTLSINLPGNEIILGPVYGSSVINQRLDDLGIPNCFTAYEGQGHVPEGNEGPYFDTTFVKARNFFSSIICNDPVNCAFEEIATGLAGITTGPGRLSVYPNPFSDGFTLQAEGIQYGELNYEIFTPDGKSLDRGKGFPGDRIRPRPLKPGIYLLSVQLPNGTFAIQRIIKR